MTKKIVTLLALLTIAYVIFYAFPTGNIYSLAHNLISKLAWFLHDYLTLGTGFAFMAVVSKPQQIVINSDLIRMLGKKLYSLPHSVILIRELFQNAIDACSQSSKAKIDITIDTDKNTITCKDTGCGMSEHVLLDVFLSIGSSYKLGASIGGFGIAKVAIFAAPQWSVKTTCGYINQDLNFNPDERTKIGTIVTCQLEDISYYTQYESEKFIYSSNWNSKQIKVTFNGNLVKPLKSSYETSGDIYTISMSKKTAKLCQQNIYRIRGLTQFVSNRYDHSDNINMVIDLECSFKPTDDSYPFSMSRESLSSDLHSKIYAKLEGILTDKYSNANKISDNGTKYVDKVSRGIALHYHKPIGKLNDLHNRRIAQLFYDICQIIPHSKPLTEYAGLTNNPECIACISNGTQAYINPENIKFTSIEGLILILWHLACHELSHQKYDYHNEEFTAEEGRLSRESSELIAKNMQKWSKKYHVLLNSKDNEG